MEYLGYNSMDEMLAKGRPFEIYSALRFCGRVVVERYFSSNMKVLCRLISKNGRLRFGHFPKNESIASAFVLKNIISVT